MSCIHAYFDDEYTSFVDEKIRKARKPHKCGECGELIRPGSVYEHARGLFDGNFFTHKTCQSCREIRTRFFHGWMYGSILDDVRDNLDSLSLGDLDDLSPGALAKIDKVMEWTT